MIMDIDTTQVVGYSTLLFIWQCWHLHWISCFVIKEKQVKLGKTNHHKSMIFGVLIVCCD